MENMMLILLLITTSKCSNATQICVEQTLTHCFHSASGRCMSCEKGYYGPTCSSKCIGECDYGCDMDTGFCEQCKDTYYTKNCMVKCSDTCDGQLCNKTTGECTNGCVKGHCSAFCKTPCDESCKDKECDFESCKCQRCNDGFVCKEDAEGPKCTQCVKNTSDVQLPTTNHCPPGRCGPSCSPKAGCDKQCGKNCKNGCNFDCTCDECNAGFFGQFCDRKKCNTIALVMMILAIAYIVGVHIKRMIRTCRQALKERESESRSGREETSEGSDSPSETQQIDHGEFPDAYSLTGINDTRRYIMTQMPSTREGDDKFLRMIWKYNIKVIVYISSRQSRVLDGYLNAQYQNSLVLTHEELDHSTWKLVLSENKLPKIARLYHDPTWFDKQGFCQFMCRVRKDKDYKMRPIVVCSSEGDGPSAVYCALDCLLDKKTSGGINEDYLDECVKRLAHQRIRMVSQKKNKQRLKECWDYVSQSDQTRSQRSLSRIPRSCNMFAGVLTSTFAIIVIIIGSIIIVCDCYA